MKNYLTSLKPSFLLALAAVFLTGTGLLHATTAGIQDNGGFFSDAAKADAKGNIADTQRKLKKDIEVETLAAMPDDVKKAGQDKAAVGKAYEQWVNKRGAELGVNGVYILLVKDPAHLQVAVGNDTQKQAFTLTDRDALVKMMLEKLRAKDYDGALRQGVSFITSTMRSHAPNSRTQPVSTTSSGPTSGSTHSTTPTTSSSSSGSGGFSWLTIIIVLVVLFIGFRIIASIFHAIFGGNRGGMSGGGMPMGGQMGGGYGGGGGGGGGFMRSMFGGILGAAAGSWIYDSFFGSHGSSAYGAPPQNYNQGDQGYSGQDTSFSSSGSDFSSSDSGSSGGGSFDSGSSGGGDFGGGGGGGDFGGGDDSGGGGGGDSGGGGGGDF